MIEKYKELKIKLYYKKKIIVRTPTNIEEMQKKKVYLKPNIVHLNYHSFHAILLFAVIAVPCSFWRAT